jgi:hypothetical protein
MCLIGSIFVFLGLAGLINRCLPDESATRGVLVLFGAQSVVHLLDHEIKGYDEDYRS